MGILFRNRKSYTGKVRFTDYQNIGKIEAFMRTSAPEGYLKCDGSTYNIADYPLLCDVFASDFGSVNYFGGNGTTTFAVPDLRGEFLRGTGTNSHTNQGSGANVGTHQDATKQATANSNKTQTTMHYMGKVDTGLGVTDYDFKFNGDVAAISASSNTLQNNFMAYSSRPTNTSVLYCIRAY